MLLPQPVDVVVEDSVDVDAAVAVEEAVVAADSEAVAVERKKLSGSQSPNWVVWSVTAKSSLSKRSTFSLFPSK